MREELLKLLLPKATGPPAHRRHPKALRTLALVQFNPVSQRLYIQAVRFGGFPTLRTPQHHRYSPQAPGSAKVLAIPRDLLQIFCCVVAVRDRYRAHRPASSRIGVAIPLPAVLRHRSRQLDASQPAEYSRPNCSPTSYFNKVWHRLLLTGVSINCWKSSANQM